MKQHLHEVVETGTGKGVGQVFQQCTRTEIVSTLYPAKLSVIKAGDDYQEQVKAILQQQRLLSSGKNPGLSEKLRRFELQT
ncbi:hypothetical protein ACFS7Z_03045 [Pontibacter toksunensis]|uniref:Uncharacterized protein n=1 Tax=Pontibacter toksunensis TaxID=1332631 RepID=A0ABW6BN81_9BACT